MTSIARRISLIEGRLAVCRLAPGAPWPGADAGALLSVTRTAEELSVVCPSEDAPAGAQVEGGWRALKLEGPIPFEEVGVLAALAAALAGAGLSLFALSTFDTDYVLVKEEGLARALDALEGSGFDVAAARRSIGR